MPGTPPWVKSWQAPAVATLQPEATGALQNAVAIVAAKNALVGFPQAPVTLRGCADGSGAFSTTLDLIVDSTDIVPATSGNHTWMHFGHPSGLQFVLDFKQANNLTFDLAVSLTAGFTGGSGSARPTAADESVRTSLTWFAGNSTGRFRLIVSHTQDGKVTYLFIIYRGIIVSMWILGEAARDFPEWNPPLVASIEGGGSLGSTTNLNFLATLTSFDNMVAKGISGLMGLRVSVPFSRGNLLSTLQSLPTNEGEWQFWAMGLVCRTAPNIGRHGRLFDMYRHVYDVPVGYVFRGPGNVSAYKSVGKGLAIVWPPDLPPAVF